MESKHAKKLQIFKGFNLESKKNPSTWVVDPENEDFIDWSKPSKSRLNAYQLTGTKTIIYLDDETYTWHVHYDWCEEKQEQKYNNQQVSLDYLRDTFDLKPCENGQFITRDSYYDFVVDNADFYEEDARVYLNTQIRYLMNSLTGTDHIVAELLSKGQSTREIARQLDVSQTVIMKRINKLREIFDKFRH